MVNDCNGADLLASFIIFTMVFFALPFFLATIEWLSPTATTDTLKPQARIRRVIASILLGTGIGFLPALVFSYSWGLNLLTSPSIFVVGFVSFWLLETLAEKRTSQQLGNSSH